MITGRSLQKLKTIWGFLAMIHEAGVVLPEKKTPDELRGIDTGDLLNFARRVEQDEGIWALLPEQIVMNGANSCPKTKLRDDLQRLLKECN